MFWIAWGHVPVNFIFIWRKFKSIQNAFLGKHVFLNAFEKHDYCSIFVILSMLPAAKHKERKDVPKNAKSAGESCCNAPNPVGQALNIKY